MTCPFDTPGCAGYSGLWFGLAPCWPCFVVVVGES